MSGGDSKLRALRNVGSAVEKKVTGNEPNASNNAQSVTTIADAEKETELRLQMELEEQQRKDAEALEIAQRELEAKNNAERLEREKRENEERLERERQQAELNLLEQQKQEEADKQRLANLSNSSTPKIEPSNVKPLEMELSVKDKQLKMLKMLDAFPDFARKPKGNIYINEAIINRLKAVCSANLLVNGGKSEISHVVSNILYNYLDENRDEHDKLIAKMAKMGNSF